MTTSDHIDPRDKRIAELEAQNARLVRENAELRKENATLHERLRKLEHFLGLDSTNSSKPPSTDSERDRKKRGQRRTRKRKQGAQPGHEGSKRELFPEDQVDAFEHHYPAQCDCGLELEQADATGTFERVQQFELVPKLVECTEHRLHTCQCPGCGAKTRATLTEPERLGWGPRLTALLATLSVTLHATRGKLDWFITHVLGAPSSKGSVQKYLEESSRALAPAYAQAHAHVLQAEVLGCDETGWRLGRLPHWIWLAQSQEAAFVQIRARRTKPAALELLEGAQARVILTDRYGAYTWLQARRNQACRAHLLRDWEQLAQRPGRHQAMGKRLVKLEKSLHKAWRQGREGESTRQDVVEKSAEIRTSMEAQWEAAMKSHETPGVVKWVSDPKHAERLWVFMEHEDVELTNNQSERDVRTCVIQRKLSFGSKSEQGLSLMERLWTVGLTCQRQSKSLLDYITQSVVAYRTNQQPPQLV